MRAFIFIFICSLFMSGCGAAESDTHSHASLVIDAHERCHMCGMMVKQYPGPKGSLHLKGGELQPKFCSTRDMFMFALQPENRRQVETLWVHDMAATDWQYPDDEHFIDATKAWYVYGSNRKAVMGVAVAPFSTLTAAEEFARQYGGAVFKYDEITLELLSAD
ncbi:MULTISPECIES: nitrous oxide reductase accessory protein NosL [Shewanella]|uniref:nitrous oxide reductase accessory protein NosL n=1 Tax=Shewanella TaxID=22 RepID=UPI001EFE8568|nr:MULTISPECIES: nitrous oxide reductase accessory protein NosL [Shewanella]MCG9748025.1 nitrous oxide reductase accessory protein NosL [Shewanella sp. Isolate8]MCL2910576.1 nitrous oxide reductase accessory protein NosL [Shewanella aquimarina]